MPCISAYVYCVKYLHTDSVVQGTNRAVRIDAVRLQPFRKCTDFFRLIEFRKFARFAGLQNGASEARGGGAELAQAGGWDAAHALHRDLLSCAPAHGRSPTSRQPSQI